MSSPNRPSSPVPPSVPPGQRRSADRAQTGPPRPGVEPVNIEALRSLVDRCMVTDRRVLHQRIDNAVKLMRSGSDATHLLGKILAETKVAAKRVLDRKATIPAVVFDEGLPISARRAEIAKAIASHQVVVVCGETGSGKSTQLPKILLEMGRGVAGFIGHTQPRRIAARSVAARIAEELGSDLDQRGSPVGFKVRFTDSTHPGTLVKIMTDGILLAETQGDRLLEKYDTLIIDEAHERSLNIDFLLGYLVRILPKRPDLKVVITSATIDPERLSNHFGGPEVCPVINVSGRTFPVEIEYRPLKLPGSLSSQDMSDPDFDEDAMEESLEQAVVATVGELCGRGPGDILVFLPGEREIRDCQELLTEAGYHKPDRGHDAIEVLPLYARLTSADQMQVFRPGRARRIVLATNVAETSITVPGIVYVIDSGLARISRYTPRSRVQRLPIEKISQASAKQRAGRCGRISAGVCIRLYSEEDFAARPAFTDPEILRDALASVILQMLNLRLGDPAQFPFVEPPDSRMVKDGYDTLIELGAVGEDHHLTKMGHTMARMPIDPRLSRILLGGADEGCLAEMLVIASALSIQDPRERPMDQAATADAKQLIFKDELSDFAGLLKLWAWFGQQQAKLSGSRLRRVCREHFVSFVRLREWREVHRQLTELLGPLQSRINRKPAKYEQVHRAILTGLLSSVAHKTDTHEYQAARGNKLSVFPGSGLFKKQPKWIVSAELVRTTRLYARCNAGVLPQWIEDAGRHLLKKSHSDPHWDAKSERVVAFEKATLFGLEIYAKRRVSFHEQDPALARDLFIKNALVEGQMQARGQWCAHNAAMLSRARTLQTRLRRSDLLADDTVRYAFFDRHIPPSVSTGHDFEHWRLSAEKSHPLVLHFSDREVFTEAARGISDADFPDKIELGGTVAELTYTNDPASERDGLSADLPIEALSAVSEHYASWLVPGLVQEKVESLIRSLPRQQRTTFIPVPHFAKAALAEIARAKLTADEGYGLEEAVAKALTALSELELTPRDFNRAELAPHLFLHYRFIDDDGRVLASGRDLAPLRSELAQRIASIIESLAPPEFNRDGLVAWDFGDLPETITLKSKGATLKAHPCLCVADGRIGLTVRASLPAAIASHRRGLRRLIAAIEKDHLERAIRNLPGLDGLRILHSTIGSARQMQVSLSTRIAEMCYLPDDAIVRTKADLDTRLAAGRGKAHAAAGEVAALLTSILTLTQTTLLQLDKLRAPIYQPMLLDIREQMDRLLEPGFLAEVPLEWLTEYPRYLTGIGKRIAKLTSVGNHLAKDEAAMVEITPRQEVYLMVVRELSARGIAEPPPAVSLYRWMLEEYRIQLFAQDLGTKLTISGKRIDQQWHKVVAELA